jgi:hypothetical protein
LFKVALDRIEHREIVVDQPPQPSVLLAAPPLAQQASITLACSLALAMLSEMTSLVVQRRQTPIGDGS